MRRQLSNMKCNATGAVRATANQRCVMRGGYRVKNTWTAFWRRPTPSVTSSDRLCGVCEECGLRAVARQSRLPTQSRQWRAAAVSLKRSLFVIDRTVYAAPIWLTDTTSSSAVECTFQVFAVCRLGACFAVLAVEALPGFSEAVRIFDNPCPERNHPDQQLHARL